MNFYNDPEKVDVYEKMCEDYDGSEIYSVLKKHLAHHSTLLELGCGPGNDICFLDKDYTVTGSDFSDEFLMRCKKKYTGMTFIKLDAVSINTDKKFDGIYSNKVLHHLTTDDLRKSVERQQKVIERNGLLAHTFWLGDKEFMMEGLLFVFHDREYLINLISEYFTIVELYDYTEIEENDSIFIVAINNKEAQPMNQDNKDYFEMNRIGWDQRAKAHFDSKFYDVEGFLTGDTSLQEIELAELTGIDGMKLLHLQCHFGLDTLSWARKGAICTGVDISPIAIEKARELADKTQLKATFDCSDVYSYKRKNKTAFDIVYTSYGTICWLPDLNKWAEIIASNLVVGGTFYMAEFHPIYDIIEGYSYFTAEVPDIEDEGTYTENGADVVTTLATWAHPLSRVVNALIGAGIQIEQLNEFPYSPYNCFEGMVERDPGRYYLSHKGQDIPIVYSLRGKKVR